MEQNTLIECRVKPGNNAAIVFIHGGSGDPRATWGRFPEFLGADPRTQGWDIYSYGYVSTGINRALDLSLAKRVKRLLGVNTDPTVSMLVTGLHTQLTTGRFKEYSALTIIAHSLGGIVSQKLLVDYPDTRTRVQFLFLMGVSSNGFRDKLYATHKMPQIDEIRPGTLLITDLRQKWKSLFIDKPAPFQYWAIAGDEDGFVPPETSLAPFPEDRQCVVRGDHESMKDPASANELVVQFVLEKMTGGLGGGRWESAQVAVELGQYQKAITRLEPNLNDLDETGLVTLAIAYESVGRTSDALAALSRVTKYADAMDSLGVLAGRLKRRWWLNRTVSDGQKALDLYSEAYQRSAAKGRSDQACYHGINVAFMRLAFQQDPVAARELAKAVLGHCEKNPLGYWRLATQGEAYLYLENVDAAVDCYRAALACDPPPRLRERQSMYDQALRVVSCLPGLESIRKPLDQAFA